MKVRIEHDVVIRLSPKLSGQVDKIIELLNVDAVNTDALGKALDGNETATSTLEKSVTDNQP